MAYTPNTWVTGDTITAQKLNNMEQGIASAGGGLLITINYSEGFMHSLDKNYSEISSAISSGALPIAVDYGTVYAVTTVYQNSNEYFVGLNDFNGSIYIFKSASETGELIYEG